MCLGIRSKLIGALVLASLLPLAILATGLVIHHNPTLKQLISLWPLLLVAALVSALCFAGGLVIASRELIRPVVTLGRAARELEQGNLDVRLVTPGEPGSVFRRDELGALAAEFNRMAGYVQQSVAELKRANGLKQQFIDVASHELRTPITYILGAVELAQRQEAIDEATLAKLTSKAQRLNRIVENMFKLLQSGSYETTLHLGEVDLSRLVRAAVIDAEIFTRPRRQRIELLLPHQAIHLHADAEKLRDVVDNVLSNAIRFSPDGAVVEIEAGDRGSQVELLVRDQGMGIMRTVAGNPFEPFVADSGDVSHHSSGEYQYLSRGIGLGLSVVKRFVELHGGNVSAEGIENGGTLVRITLPRPPCRIVKEDITCTATGV